MSTPPKLAEEVLTIARQAGDAILAIYEGDFAVETKSDHSPLTAADMAAHRLIASELGSKIGSNGSKTPTVSEASLAALPLLSEEGGLADFDVRKTWDRYWLVDPLDGTREFVKRNGEFTVNIALISNGRPVLGVVHAPVLRRSYVGVLDGISDGKPGAWRIDEVCGQSSYQEIRTRTANEAALTLAVSRSHGSPAVQALLEQLPAVDTTSMGSSLKFCLVAEGAADAYPRFGPTSEWDSAAAQAVLEAAGGAVQRMDGAPLTYNQKVSVLNPDFIAIGDPDWRWANLTADFPINER